MTEDPWLGYQLTLELPEATQRAIPESTTPRLVEALRDLLLQAGTAIVERAAQEVDDDD